MLQRTKDNLKALKYYSLDVRKLHKRIGRIGASIVEDLDLGDLDETFDGMEFKTNSEYIIATLAAILMCVHKSSKKTPKRGHVPIITPERCHEAFVRCLMACDNMGTLIDSLAGYQKDHEYHQQKCTEIKTQVLEMKGLIDQLRTTIVMYRLVDSGTKVSTVNNDIFLHEVVKAIDTVVSEEDLRVSAELIELISPVKREREEEEKTPAPNVRRKLEFNN